jgi:DNA-binding transcriptional LysR family regulator
MKAAMQLEALRVFVAVSEAGGFAAAARKLRLSPPAVTRSIAALEEHLGARLLHRTTRIVRLTEAGERFLADGRRILAAIEEAEAAARGAHVEPQGELGVTAPALFGRMHVAPILMEFLGKHPKVRVRALFADRVVHLVDEGFDVAVRIAPLPDSSLTAKRVGSVRRVVVASPAYLAAHGTPRTPEALEGHRAVAFLATGGAANPWMFRAPGGGARIVARPQVSLRVNAGEVAIDAALAGHGLSRALSYQVREHVAAGRLVVVLEAYEPPPVPVQVVYPEGRRAAAKVSAFVDFAVERLRKDPALTG